MAEIGVIASVIGIAEVGAKLSIALFDFASTIGSAASEITAIGIEISQFCVVVKQVESTLTKARNTVRYSISALMAIEQITTQCQPVFDDINKILTDLTKGKAEPNFLGRLKWTLKRSKVQILQKTLEASKLTLSCMLMTLLFAENVSSRSAITDQTQQEDEHQKIVTQSLLVARQCAVNDLESMEDSMSLEQQESEFQSFVQNLPRSPSLSPISMEMRSSNRHSTIMDGVFLPSLGNSENASHKRSSVLLNEVMPGDTSEMRRLTWEDALSSSYIRAQPVHLVRTWTEQGDRLSRLIADDEQFIPQELDFGSLTSDENPRTGLETVSDIEIGDETRPAQSFQVVSKLAVRSRQPVTTSAHSMPESLSSKPSLPTSLQSFPPVPSPPLRKAYNTGRYHAEEVEILKHFRVLMDDLTYKILPAALKKYNIQDDWTCYDLYVIFGDQERCLDLFEKPLRIFKQLDREGKRPIFMLRKRVQPIDESILRRLEINEEGVDQNESRTTIKKQRVPVSRSRINIPHPI